MTHRIDIEEVTHEYYEEMMTTDDFLAVVYAWRDEQVTDAIRALRRKNPDPPSGWYYFGTHAAWDESPGLIFSEETGEDGLPLWEKIFNVNG